MSITGILFDVSRSMEENIGSGTDEQGGPWARSIFEVIDDLIEHDVSSENRVFAFGVGANCSEQEIFDVIGTVQKIEKKEMPPFSKNMPATEEHIAKIFNILEKNGARNVRNWTRVGQIQELVSDNMAALILMKLESDQQFLTKFVHEFLPSACRDTIPDPDRLPDALIILYLPILLLSVTENAISSTVSQFKTATTEDICQVVEKAKCSFLKQVGMHSIFSVQDASQIIRGCVDEKVLSVERSRELLENVEPFIYGRTPLYQAIDKAKEIFRENNAKNKLLFVLSDGEPTDGNNENSETVRQVRRALEDLGVNVVSCFITRSQDIQPKRLYDKMTANWESGARFLFSLSSKLPTELLPRSILVKRGWTIDIANNETKLFMQVNHPDNLKEACDMARNVVYCHDSLADLLVSVDLDIYINQTKGGFEAKRQEGRTCYANASAAVLHLAMKRILGREGGYPNFQALRNEMIQSYGTYGANTNLVLQAMCPKYRLHCREVNVKEAMEAVIRKRPVVAIFRLTDQEWDAFSDFYRNNPTGILAVNEINVQIRSRNALVSGHAVVLSSYNSKCLYLMNSWGSDFADKGFFRVEDANVLQLQFIDVFWTENDLTAEEKAYYEERGPEVARNLMEQLKGLQKSKYKCPRCARFSLVTEFTGTISEAECPKCLQKFSARDDDGNILALNMYLTTLAR